MFSVIHRGCFWHNFFNFPFVPKFEKHTPQLFLCPISTLRKAKREIVVLKIDMSTHLRSSSSTVKSSLISLVYAKACLRTLHILSQSVQSLSHVRLFVTHGLPHARHPCPSPTSRFTQTHVHWSVMPSNHLILCHPLLHLPSIFPSIKVFSNESVLHISIGCFTKYWSFSSSISLSNEYSRLISFRMDWLDFLAVQGTSKSLL